MSLVGAHARRRIALPVSVDGVDNGTALGVMSQGELHALGLATFLPRSCAEEGPFRFIIIDDPVQSMDQAVSVQQRLQLGVANCFRVNAL
jgi:hypothetical protein